MILVTALPQFQFIKALPWQLQRLDSSLQPTQPYHNHFCTVSVVHEFSIRVEVEFFSCYLDFLMIFKTSTAVPLNYIYLGSYLGLTRAMKMH